MNVLSYTNQLDNAAWTKEYVTVASVSVLTWDGRNVADFLKETVSGDTWHVAYQSGVAPSGTLFRTMVYARSAGRPGFFLVVVFNGVQILNQFVNIASGTVITNGNTPFQQLGMRLTPLPDGWFRHTSWVRMSSPVSAWDYSLYLHGPQVDSVGQSVYPGDGASGVVFADQWLGPFDSKQFLDLPVSYPLREFETARILVSESESGRQVRNTRWLFPRREWDVSLFPLARQSDVASLRSLVADVSVGGESFWWKEPYPSARPNVYLGTGTGSRDAWTLPVWAPSTFTLFVNSIPMTVGSQYRVDSFYCQHSHHILRVESLYANSGCPAAGDVLHVSYVDGHFTPLVRMVGDYSQQLVRPGWDRFSAGFTLQETKEDMPDS